MLHSLGRPSRVPAFQLTTFNPGAFTSVSAQTTTWLCSRRSESARKRGELDSSHKALTYAIAQLRHWDGRRRNFIAVLDAAEFMVCEKGSIQARPVSLSLGLTVATSSVGVTSASRLPMMSSQGVTERHSRLEWPPKACQISTAVSFNPMPNNLLATCCERTVTQTLTPAVHVLHQFPKS